MKVLAPRALVCLAVLSGAAVASVPLVYVANPSLATPFVQVQTKCASCGLKVEEHFKFCTCGVKTDFGKYSDSIKAAEESEAKGDFRAASDSYLEAAIRRVSDIRKAAALTGAGRNFFALSEFSNAQRELEKARKFDEQGAEISLLLGRVCFATKDFEKATTFFREANQFSGKPSYAALYLGDIAFDRKEFDEARKQYLLAEPEHENNFRMFLRLGSTLRMANDIPGAIRRMERAHALEPKQIQPAAELAEMYESQSRWKDAAVMYGKAAAGASTSYEYPLKEGAMYVKIEDWNAAHRAFQIAHARNPSSFEALLGMAQIELLFKDDLVGASEHLDLARRLRPDNMQVEFLSGLVTDLRDQRPNAIVVQHDAVERQPAWSPTGTSIAFQSNRDRGSHIYTQKLGDRPVRITTKGSNGCPTWSPDGKTLVYHSKDKNTEIMAFDLATKRERNLTNNPADDGFPDWSADGKHIVFQSNRGSSKKLNIYIMNADGSGVRALTNEKSNNEEPKISPDGKRIVFTSDRSGSDKVWIMNADGTGQKMLTSPTQKDRERYMSWSPEGDRIAFCARKRDKWAVWVMNADGSGVARLNKNEESEVEPAWNPNGVRIMTAFGVETKAAGTTDSYGATISGGIKQNYEIRVQIAPRR